MRTIRSVLAVALLAPAVVVVASTVTSAASAASPTYTLLTASGSYNSEVAAYADATNPKLSFSFATPSDQVSATLMPAHQGEEGTDLAIYPYQGESLSVGTFTTAPSAPAPGQVGFDFDTGGCATSAPGSIDIRQLRTASGTGDITAFAADYSVSCNNQTITGQVRWHSTLAVRAVSYSPGGWDFGTQTIKQSGPKRTFTITNHSPTAQAFQAASFSGPSGVFTASADTCANRTIPSGGSCQVTVTAKAKSDAAVAAGVLGIKATGRPAVRIPLSVVGSASAPLYTQPSAGEITLHWGQIGAPLADTVANAVFSYRIYRGTSPTALSFLTNAEAFAGEFVDSGISTGRAYYYAIRPELFDGTTPAQTAVVAAEAWPKYSAGMYHALNTPVRVVSAHPVTAGHPYTLKLLGLGGIPSTGVSAVALDLEVSNPSAATNVWVYPAGAPQPSASDLYVGARSIRTNSVIANLGKGGAITIMVSHGSAPVYLDVSGYFSAAGLATSHGEGGTLQEYLYPGTILDTKGFKYGPLKHDYYIPAPVNFSAIQGAHVTSLVVEVTAYGSSGSGTLAGYPTDDGSGPIPGTSVLAYSPGVTTSNMAIIKAGRFYSSQGPSYPSVSFFNRGADPVQLVVTILGFFDDNNFFVYGSRYVPTAPVHLFAKSMGSNTSDTFAAGTHGDRWTSAFNLKMAAFTPTAATALGLRAVGYGPAPQDGQLHAQPHTTAVGSVLNPVGNGNQMSVHNAAGTVNVSLWSDGRFEEYPQPDAYGYSNGDVMTVPPQSMTASVSRPAR